MVAIEVFPAITWADRVAAEPAARLVAEPGLRLCLTTGWRGPVRGGRQRTALVV